MERTLLVSKLQEFGAIARRQTHRVASAVYRKTDAGIDAREFTIYSESAAFFAFRDLGGDPDHAELFDWTAQRDAMVRETQSHLKKILRGPDQVASDVTRRNIDRRNGAMVEELRWHAWAPFGPAHAAPKEYVDRWAREANLVQATHASADSPVISAELDDKLAALGKALAEALTPEELRLITAHYFQGKSQFELAKDLASVDPRYADATGTDRAYNSVMVKICRARQKLKKKLGAQWLGVKRDLDDVA